jgi:hypothetical protein
MIKVFTAEANVDIFLDWFGENSNFQRCLNYQEVLAQDVKIACVPIYFDTNEFPYEKFDLILISDIEFNNIDIIEKWIEELEIKNYLVAVGGVEKYSVFKDYICRPWWAFNLINPRHWVRNKSKQVYKNYHEYDFDILLGAKKSHRDFIMAKCQKSQLLETSIVNYRSCFTATMDNDAILDQHVKNLLENESLLHPYVSNNLEHAWEVTPEITNGVSHWVPWEIYSHTKYSVIPETFYDQVFFFSEKSAKALLGRRVFVIFSCQYYLETMRTLFGFRTFSNIIDESYDQEENDITRFNMAFEQMEWLTQQDYYSIKERTKDIVDYNYKRLFDLRQEIADEMLQMVYNKIEEIKC